MCERAQSSYEKTAKTIQLSGLGNTLLGCIKNSLVLLTKDTIVQYTVKKKKHETSPQLWNVVHISIQNSEGDPSQIRSYDVYVKPT